LSWTATVLVLCDLSENYPTGEALNENFVELPPPILEINSWLLENEQDPLKSFSESIEQGHVAGANLYGTVLNHGELDKLVSFIRGLKWVAPQDVQILIKDENESHFTLHTIS
jgi:hypothetical protein